MPQAPLFSFLFDPGLTWFTGTSGLDVARVSSTLGPSGVMVFGVADPSVSVPMLGSSSVSTGSTVVGGIVRVGDSVGGIVSGDGFGETTGVGDALRSGGFGGAIGVGDALRSGVSGGAIGVGDALRSGVFCGTIGVGDAFGSMVFGIS